MNLMKSRVRVWVLRVILEFQMSYWPAANRRQHEILYWASIRALGNPTPQMGFGFGRATTATAAIAANGAAASRPNSPLRVSLFIVDLRQAPFTQ